MHEIPLILCTTHIQERKKQQSLNVKHEQTTLVQKKRKNSFSFDKTESASFFKIILR